jgi:hypothetical protein
LSVSRSDSTPDLFPATLPAPPRPHRWCAPRNDAWRLAQEFCDRMRCARDAREKAQYRRSMVQALKGGH